MLLMRRMNAGQVLHSGSKFILLETLINQKIVLLMHGSVATLARASEDFESSSQCGGVEGVPGLCSRPVAVTVDHTNGVDLFFVTLDTSGSTNIISEDPGFAGLLS